MSSTIGSDYSLCYTHFEFRGYALVAQLDRVPGYEPGGREFESLRARHFGLVMSKEQQWIEILACPSCLGSLSYRENPESLLCHSCALAYPIVDEIPVLIRDRAQRLDDAAHA